MSLTSYLPRNSYINFCLIFPKPKKKKKEKKNDVCLIFWKDLCNGNFAVSLKLVM